MPFRVTALGLISAAALLAGCGSSSSSSSSSSSNSSSSSSATSSSASSPASPSSKSSAAQVGFEGVAIEPGSDLGPATTGTNVVDGIQCGSTEQLAYHIHAHLAVYVSGQARALPGGIGIPGSTVQQTAQGPEAVGGQCIYWLHTHAPDGVIHIESPTQRLYTLGNFFDEWHQPLSANQVAGAGGKVTAFVNGKPWTKDPRAIPLTPHAVIQLSVGNPSAPFHPMSWASLQL